MRPLFALHSPPTHHLPCAYPARAADLAETYPKNAPLDRLLDTERQKVCPFLRWDAPYLSDAFLRRPTSASCGVVLDIGANIGLSALPPAALGWRVLAFEPNAYNVQRLRLNLHLNGLHDPRHVHIVHAAAGESNGTATLYSPEEEKFSAVSSLTKANLQHYHRTGKGHRRVYRRTRLLRLDDYFTRAAPQGGAQQDLWELVGVIKLDVQARRDC
jgi:FkbM family methyltransferase